MTQPLTGWLLFAVMIGAALALIGAEVTALPDWDAAASPGFVGQSLVHVGSVIGAFLAGKAMPMPPRS